MYNLNKFLLDLNASFGSGGMSAWFRDKELPEFVHYLKKDKDLPVKQAASILGKQPDCMCIMGFEPNFTGSMW